MPYILSMLIAAGAGSTKATGQGTEPGLGEAQPQATPPVIVNFQGHLRQGTTIINGTYAMTFRLYNAAAGGTLLQTMSFGAVQVYSGVFNVELPITQANILNYTDLWVEVDIPGLGGIYTPRVKINSAAFAYNAFMSDTTQRIRDFAVTPQDLVLGPPPTQLNDFDLDNNGRIDLALLDVPASGTDPGYIWNQFAVNQAAPGSFRIATRGRAGADPPGRFGELAYGGGGAGTDVGGVYGQFSNTTAYGYLGVQRAGLGNVGVLGNGGNNGVFGQNNADYLNGAGVEGYSAFAASGIGGLFTGNASDSSYVFNTGGGVYGTGTNFGVAGFSNTTYANGAGVSGRSLNAASGIGVVGAGNNLAPTVPIYGCGVAGTGDTVGTFGYATLAGGTGVWGQGANASSNGVYGSSPGTNSWGAVEGYATGGTGIGGLFTGNATTGWYPTDGAGVVGNGTVFGTVGFGVNAANAVGVEGVGNGGGLRVVTNQECGVFGTANDGVAVAGYVVNSISGWAGYFWGDIYAYGYYKDKGPGGGGNILASGVMATVVPGGTSPKGLFSITSSDVKVYFDGKARLENGVAHVEIPTEYRNVISGDIEVVATPIGTWSGIYVESATSESFTVRSGAGDPNAEFKWIAVATRKGYEGGKANDLLANKDFSIEAREVPMEKSSSRSSWTGQIVSVADEPKAIKVTHKRTPADAQELKEVK
ncbi:MAG: hypothetical protein ACP5QG_00175 [candidate division WOR-3 bacterium]